MNRIEKSEQKFKELFGNMEFSGFTTDPDLHDILIRFIFGDIFFKGILTTRNGS